MLETIAVIIFGASGAFLLVCLGVFVLRASRNV